MNRVALQLYTVRVALAASVGETLRRVREAGYEWVETAPLPEGVSSGEYLEGLKREGLKVMAVHAELPWGDGERERVLGWAEALGSRRVIWHGWPRSEECGSLAGYERLADRYNEVCGALEGRGYEFGIHNHWWEFEQLEGGYPYQVLGERLARGVFWELDVYWVKTAGMDPARALRELGARVKMVHLKDGPAVHGQPMTALGRGVVDIGLVMRAAPEGVDWVVEMDECAGDVFEAARESYENLGRWQRAGWSR